MSGEWDWTRFKFWVVVGCWDCRVLSVRVNFSLVPTILWSSDDETWLIVTPFGLPQVWVGGCLLTQTRFTLTSVYIILRIVIILLFFGAWISLHILPLRNDLQWITKKRVVASNKTAVLNRILMHTCINSYYIVKSSILVYVRILLTSWCQFCQYST